MKALRRVASLSFSGKTSGGWPAFNSAPRVPRRLQCAASSVCTVVLAAGFVRLNRCWCVRASGSLGGLCA